MVGQAPAAANAAVAAAKPGFKVFSDLNRIGGWLILVAFGLVVSPFACLSTIMTEYPLLTRGEHQPVLGEHVSFATLITLEIAINAAFIAGLLCLNFLFFTKKKIFPKWMIVYLVAQIFLSVLDMAAAAAIVSSAAPPVMIAGLVRPILGALIWIPYFSTSKRVKATFVN
jgi:ABC-type phosphate/phosphonate transport system permease subunit